MPFPFDSYDYFVFDCDGVILDSNPVKSEAFYKTTEHFGADLARSFVEYHQRNGGISRNEKFRYFIEQLLNRELDPSLLEQLLQNYGTICQRELMACPLITGVESFLQQLPTAKPAYVVTGGNQQEVRSIFKQRQLAPYFRHIRGSPTSKKDNMTSLQTEGKFIGTGVYFGDARLDMELAEMFGQDFIYISGASEWTEGSKTCSDRLAVDFAQLAQS